MDCLSRRPSMPSTSPLRGRRGKRALRSQAQEMVNRASGYEGVSVVFKAC